MSIVIPSGVNANPEPIVRESSITAVPWTSNDVTIFILCVVTTPSVTINFPFPALIFPIVEISPLPEILSTFFDW